MTVDVTRMSRNGQVVIPKSIRDKLNLQSGEPLIASDVDGRIVLSSARGESIRAEFQAIAAEFDRRLTKKERAIDAVELVRRLREEEDD